MMVLHSGLTCPFSHRCRIVLYEKGMDFEIKNIDLANKLEDLALLNPYNQVPVLVERDLVLYESNIINEYIDERFPHPQLMASDPSMRARSRLFLYRIETEIFKYVHVLEKDNESKKIIDNARSEITNGLIGISSLFSKQQKYVYGDNFSIVDVALAPLLWRLERYNINLGNSAVAILKYSERLFQRNSFIDSLTPAEKALRR